MSAERTHMQVRGIGGRQMKRGMEAVLIAAVTAMTIAGTLDVFRMQSTQNPVDVWFGHLWTQVRAQAAPSFSTWGSDRTIGSPSGPKHHEVSGGGAHPATANGSGTATGRGQVTVPGSPPISGRAAPSRSGSTEGMQRTPALASRLDTKIQPAKALSDEDVARINAMGQSLMQSLSGVEWQQIATALTSQNLSSADDKTVLQILRSHLSDADAKWLSTRFVGRHGGADQDMASLQRSMSQAESELTPTLRRLLESELDAPAGTPQTGSSKSVNGGSDTGKVTKSP